jgi:hypothetical protein
VLGRRKPPPVSKEIKRWDNREGNSVVNPTERCLM